ncbi:MAG: hypothetical protein RhofKO_21260 [Rhodothermales bacterium]
MRTAFASLPFNRIDLMRTLTTRLLTFAVALVLITGCDSNEEATPAEEIATIFSSLQVVFVQAFTAGLGGDQAAKVQPIIDCQGGGTADVTNNNSGNNLNVSMSLDNCSGVTGSLTVGGNTSFDFQSNSFAYNMRINGDLSSPCTVNYNNFGYNLEGNSSGAYTGTLNGQISATCDGGSTTCNFNGIEFSQDSNSAFINACN